MPYVSNAPLADLYDPDPLDEAIQKLSKTAGDRSVYWTQFNTPVDMGNLKTSFRDFGPRPAGRDVRGDPQWESGVETDVPYAPDVEYGTGLWGPKRDYIRPKTGQFLSWITSKGFVDADGKFVPPGTRVYRRRVKGYPGFGMVRTGLNVTQRTMPAWARPILDEWRRSQDRLGRGSSFKPGR